MAIVCKARVRIFLDADARPVHKAFSRPALLRHSPGAAFLLARTRWLCNTIAVVDAFMRPTRKNVQTGRGEGLHDDRSQGICQRGRCADCLAAGPMARRLGGLPARTAQRHHPASDHHSQPHPAEARPTTGTGGRHLVGSVADPALRLGRSQRRRNRQRFLSRHGDERPGGRPLYTRRDRGVGLDRPGGRFRRRRRRAGGLFQPGHADPRPSAASSARTSPIRRCAIS